MRSASVRGSTHAVFVQHLGGGTSSDPPLPYHCHKVCEQTFCAFERTYTNTKLVSNRLCHVEKAANSSLNICHALCSGADVQLCPMATASACRKVCLPSCGKTSHAEYHLQQLTKYRPQSARSCTHRPSCPKSAWQKLSNKSSRAQVSLAAAGRVAPCTGMDGMAP